MMVGHLTLLIGAGTLRAGTVRHLHFPILSERFGWYINNTLCCIIYEVLGANNIADSCPDFNLSIGGIPY